MKEFLLTATYLVGAGELVLAWYFWKTRSGNEIRKVMALLAFSTGMWVIFSALTLYTPQTTSTSLAMKFVYVFGAFLITALLHLTLVFPYQLFRMDRVHSFLLYCPALFFSWLSLTTQSIVKGFTGSSTNSGVILPGPVYNSYNLFILLIYILSLVILFYRQHRADGLHRINLRLVFWSVFIGGLPAVLVDLLIPTFIPSVNPNTI